MALAETASRALKQPSPLREFIRSQPVGAASLLFLAALAGASAFAHRISPYDPMAIDFAAMLQGPDARHWFGTDNFGRDVMTRLLYGGRTALMIGLLASLTGCISGGVIGMISAYAGGRVDFFTQRLLDMLMSFPIIVLAVVVAAMLGKRIVFGVDLNLVAAIAVPIAPKAARVVRAAALTVMAMPYMDAARAAGFSRRRIVFRHMAPNVAAPFVILLAAYVAQAILLEASLSFLGLGVTEPTPAWGLMLSGNAADFYREAPWMILFPGLAISSTVFAFNLFGDALRDFLDPKFAQ